MKIIKSYEMQSLNYVFIAFYKILGIAFFILVISSMLNLGDAADY